MTSRSLSVGRRLSAGHVAAANRSYADAVAALNTLQSNFAVVDAVRKYGKKMNEQSIPEMIEWARRLGYKPSDFDSLHAIHIAGTKGKGSTAAYLASILAQFRSSGNGHRHHHLHLPGPSNIGLFTSPHLRFVRERIQINGSPLSEDQFARYFFDTWDRLEEAAAAAEGNTDVDPASVQTKPSYFRFLTLMAFHAFARESCDPAIIECGIGGTYDSTNIIERPSVTAITSLGIDHVAVLGHTLAEIAWHKAGIMKAGAKCYTPASQPDEAKAVLDRVAAERGVELVYVPVAPELSGAGHDKLALQADFQRINASLAIAIAEDYLLQKDVHPERDRILRGIESARWPGRCDVRPEPENSIVWCLDGGHTLDSIQEAGKWFAARRRLGSKRAARSCLIFNQQARDAPSLAKALHAAAAAAAAASTTPTDRPSRPFDTVIFCTNTTYKESGFRPDQVSINTNPSDVDELKVQKELAHAWSAFEPGADVHVVRTIEEAVQLVRLLSSNAKTLPPPPPKHTDGEGTDVLITGSLHLVGGAVEVLEGEEERGERSHCQVHEVAWQ